MTAHINILAAGWWSWMVPILWQTALLAAFVWALDVSVLRRRGWPQVRYALWLLVFARLLLPPTFALPTSLTARLLALRRTAPVTVQPHVTPNPVSADFDLPDLPPTHRAMVETLPEAPAAPAAPRESPRVPLSAKAWVMFASTAVSLFFLAWLFMRLLRLRRLARRAAQDSPVPTPIAEALAQHAAQLGLRRLPRLVMTDGVPSAAVCGVFRQKILFLPETYRDLPREQLGHVLLHELAHLKRRDLLVNAAQSVLHILYWFNPVLWLAGRRLRNLREICCDATVANLLRERTGDYCRTLVDVAARASSQKFGPALGLLGLFESPSRLRQRIECLARPAWKHRRLRWIVAAVSAAIVVSCVAPMGPIQKEAAWGPVSNGLQCRLLPLEQTVQVAAAAKPEEVEVFATYELRNVGGKPLKFLPEQTPLLGGMSASIFRVIGPDGKAAEPWIPFAVRGPSKPEDYLTIGPGKQLVARARVSHDFTRVGDYQLSTMDYAEGLQEYYGGDATKARENPDNFWTGTLTSEIVTVKVVRKGAAELPWGEAVRGWQCRLRADRGTWTTAETPMLKFDVRNAGPDELSMDITTQQLQADGTWFNWAGTIDFETAPLSNGKEQAGSSIPLNDSWKEQGTNKPLRLAEGKHTLRIRVAAMPAKPAGGAPPVAVSNAVTITIERPLPKSKLSIQEAMKDKDFSFAAVCEAAAAAQVQEGIIHWVQEFKVSEALVGKGPANALPLKVHYVTWEVSDPRERCVQKGEHVIWIIAKKNDQWRGLKALADTPENRKAVTDAAKGTVADAAPAPADVRDKEINLGDRIGFQLLDKDDAEPGMVPCGIMQQSRQATSAELYAWARKNPVPDTEAPALLVGRLKYHYSAMDELRVLKFARTGNKVRIEIAWIPHLLGSVEDKRAYFEVNLRTPIDLPPGRYEAVAVVNEYERHGDKIEPAPKLHELRSEQLACMFTIPPATAAKPATYEDMLKLYPDADKLRMPTKEEVQKRASRMADMEKELIPPNAKAVGPVVEEGVVFGIWLDKLIWDAADVPVFKAMLSHRGKRELPRLGAYRIEVDGEWFVETGADDARDRAFQPRRDYQDIGFTLDNRWRDEEVGSLLSLRAGRHLIRLAFDTASASGAAQTPLRVMSNIAQFRLLGPDEKAIEDEWFELASGGRPGSRYSAKQVAEMYRAENHADLALPDLAKFYAKKALELSQTGPDGALLTDAVEKALALPQDEMTKLRLYVFLGDGYQLQTRRYSPEVWGMQRRAAAEAYFLGLREVLKNDLPAEPPPMPPAGLYNIDGPPAIVEKYRKKQEAEAAAQKEARRIGDLVRERQTLAGQIVYIYSRPPDAFEELRALTLKYVGNEKAAGQLINAAQERRNNYQSPIPAIEGKASGDPSTNPSPSSTPLIPPAAK